MLLEELFTVLVMDAYEGRYVSAFDVLGGYLNKNIHRDKIVLLKLRGRFVEIMCDINP